MRKIGFFLLFAWFINYYAIAQIAPPVRLSPTVANSGDDVWYYIANPRRAMKGGGQVFTDSEGALVQSLLTDTKNDAQLWKVIQQSGDPGDANGNYVFVNKATGNMIDCSNANGSNLNVMTAPGSDAAPNTFRFYDGTAWNTGYYVINCVEKAASINKINNATNGINRYCIYGNPAANDEGNCVAFFEEGQENAVFELFSFPKLSTYDDEHWYLMQFQRVGITKAITDQKVANANLLQSAVATGDADPTAQYWKFVGSSTGDMKIESYAGYEVAFAGASSRFVSVSKNGGDSFKFDSIHSLYSNYVQVYDNTLASGNRYFNDVSGSGTEVSTYTGTDGGSQLYFTNIAVPAEFTVSDNTVDFSETAVGASKTISFAVNVRNLVGDDEVTYTTSGSAVFDFTPVTGWSAKRGGTLEITFTPDAEQDYSASLEISANGETKTIDITGTGVLTPIIDIDKQNIEFGDVTIGLQSEVKPVNIAVYNIEGEASYELTGEDANAFEVDATGWNPETGGTLGVIFKPTEEKDYNATLEISAKDTETKEIALTGTGVLTELPVVLSDENSETWYYMQLNDPPLSGTTVTAMLGNKIIQDLGNGNRLETRPAIESEDGQLWKFVSTGISGKYRIISKAGNEIVYAGGVFTTTNSDAGTYRFDKRSDDAWQIFSNEANAYLNKIPVTSGASNLQNDQITSNDANPANGSSIAFIPEGDMEFHLPQFSSANNAHEYWYRIKFSRKASSNLAIRVNDVNADLSQTATDENDLNQYWKLVGTWDNFKLVSVYNTEVAYNAASGRYQAAAAGSGNSFKLVWNSNVYETWRIYDIANNTMMDDQQGATVTHYSEYVNDAGNAIAFFPVTQTEPIDFVINAEDQIDASLYKPSIYGNIVFKSTDASTGQLTGIAENGLVVNGVVEVVKTFTPAATYSIGFPFAIESVSDEGITLKSYNGTTNSFENANAIAANTGYLMTLNTGEEKDITFVSAEAPTLYNTTTPASSLTSGYSLVANPSVENVNAIEDVEYYYVYADGAFTLLNAETALTLKPFEAVIAVKDVIDPSWVIGEGMVGIPDVTATDPVILVKYYTPQGVEVRKPVVNGVYIVKKVYASQKFEIGKEIYQVKQ